MQKSLSLDKALLSMSQAGYGELVKMLITLEAHGIFKSNLNIIQLLTNEALDMMWYRPDNTNIDRGEAEVNIGILWSISHHIQCLISQ